MSVRDKDLLTSSISCFYDKKSCIKIGLLRLRSERRTWFESIIAELMSLNLTDALIVLVGAGHGLYLKPYLALSPGSIFGRWSRNI